MSPAGMAFVCACVCVCVCACARARALQASSLLHTFLQVWKVCARGRHVMLEVGVVGSHASGEKNTRQMTNGTVALMVVVSVLVHYI